MTPVRAALEASTHAEATAISVAATGLGISQQAYALRSKILEVQDWLPTASFDVFEVHPEVSFTMMLGQPARAPKKSWHGMMERRSALAAVGIPLEHVDPMVGAAVGGDDMLDAAAAAWTATRLLAGAARSFPDPPEAHPSGRPVAIWA
jgi:predicted RNase H-like nuclease